MKLNLLLLSLLCIVGAWGEKEKSLKPDKKIEPKPKREASISGGGVYHGPSYKYLPPSTSGHSGGFDSYSDHSSFGSTGNFELGSSGIGASHGHGDLSYGSSGPKVETYIVQTETGHGTSQIGSGHGLTSHGFGGSNGLSGLHGFTGSLGGSGSHSGIGYKYAGPSTSFTGGHGAHQNSYSGAFSHGHSPVHKIKAIVIPAHGFSAGTHGIGSGSDAYSRFGGHKSGYNYAKGLTRGTHFSAASGGDFTGHRSASSAGFNSGHFSGLDYSAPQGSYNNEHGQGYSTHSSEASYRESDHLGSQGGYSYETPSSEFSHGHAHGSSPSSYAVTNILSPPYSSGNTGHQPPAYAAGHKGLGHFGFAASRPQPLNTNFIDSSRYGSSHSSQGHSGGSSAPFRPSLFLGTSHESSSLGGSSVSTEYGPPAGNQAISSQYLPPPTSNGYEYAPPSALYGAPPDAHSHDAVASSGHEPENSYLPPHAVETSYGPPAAPEDTYLPPHH